ncbi:MAG: hypothetical protein U0T84_07455 [Chitinophagales bacterium]
METPKGDFCIEIDFDKDSRNPERVFNALSSMIGALKSFDESLVDSISGSIQPVLLLEDIETGSIRVWLRQLLEKVDDDALKDLDWKKQIGAYLVKAKYVAIDFLHGKTRISDGDELRQLLTKLYELAQQTDVNKFPAYSPVKISDLISNIDKINKSLQSLSDKDTAKFIAKDGTATFNAEFNFSPEDIEDLLTRDKIENTTEMILKVKKPDYLGNSKWEFKHDNRTIDAKITDEVWVKRFQQRLEDVRPGDSIKGKVKILVKYGYDSTVIGTNYEVISVLGVIRDESITIEIFPK